MVVVGVYPSAEMQLVYSTAPADWVIFFFSHICLLVQHSQTLSNDPSNIHWLGTFLVAQYHN